MYILVVFSYVFIVDFVRSCFHPICQLFSSLDIPLVTRLVRVFALCVLHVCRALFL